jgi:hypothetical protein
LSCGLAASVQARIKPLSVRRPSRHRAHQLLYVLPAADSARATCAEWRDG